MTKILSDTGDAITFIGEVPPLPEAMVTSTQQIINAWPDAAKRQRAQKALDARRPIGEIISARR